MTRGRAITLCLMLALGSVGQLAHATARAGLSDDLYASWLTEVSFLISDEERNAFTTLRTDAEREAFIRGFWKARDPDPETPHNELRERFRHQARELRGAYHVLDDERLAVRISAGKPQLRHLFEGCGFERPLLVWRFGSEVPEGALMPRQDAGAFSILFKNDCKDASCDARSWRLWSPEEGLGSLVGDPTFNGDVDAAILRARRFCRGAAAVWEALRQAIESGQGREEIKARSTLLSPAHGWWESLPRSPEALPARLEITFPGSFQRRTIVFGRVELPRQAVLERIPTAAQRASLILEGNLFRAGQPVERFRFRFHLPLRVSSGETIQLDFHRYLEPGSYTLALRVLDGLGESQALNLASLEVPDASTPDAMEAELEAELEAEAESGGLDGRGTSLELFPAVTVIEIAPLPPGLQIGSLRVDAVVTGPRPAAVRYLLDGELAGTAVEPPYTVTVDLGQIPRTAKLEAVAVTAQGRPLARDAVPINAGPQRFAVRLLEPAGRISLAPEVRLRAAVDLPQSAELDRLELYLGDELAATLYQPPFIHTLALPAGHTASFVKAVAFLDDGRRAEDAVLLGGAQDADEIGVELVEVLTTVIDRKGKLVDDLDEADFELYEEGERRSLTRFERLQDLPLHVMVLLDVSSSMAPRLEQARASALAFFEQVVTARDRVALSAFRHETQLVGSFTSDVEALALAAGSLEAWGGTALNDSVILSLHHFGGLSGARALIIISDGADQHSRFRFDEVLDYARRAGVVLYSLSLPGISRARELRRLSEETGGRHFRVRKLAKLGEIYAQLERELRSQYLLTFQPPAGVPKGFRSIRVEIASPGLEARSRRGYFRD